MLKPSCSSSAKFAFQIDAATLANRSAYASGYRRVRFQTDSTSLHAALDSFASTFPGTEMRSTALSTQQTRVMQTSARKWRGTHRLGVNNPSLPARRQTALPIGSCTEDTIVTVPGHCIPPTCLPHTSVDPTAEPFRDGILVGYLVLEQL